MLDDPNKPSWRRRRRMMYVVSFFTMAVIAYCLVRDTDTQVHQTAVSMGFSALIAIVGSYVFGAVWDDKK